MWDATQDWNFIWDVYLLGMISGTWDVIIFTWDSMWDQIAFTWIFILDLSAFTRDLTQDLNIFTWVSIWDLILNCPYLYLHVELTCLDLGRLSLYYNLTEDLSVSVCDLDLDCVYWGLQCHRLEYYF